MTIIIRTTGASTRVDSSIRRGWFAAICHEAGTLASDCWRGMASAAPTTGVVGPKALARVRMPENFPAHPRQYLARSLLGV
jgi:hypothetical protein